MAEQVIDTPAPTGLSQLEQLQFDYINLQLHRVNMIAELEKAHPELILDQASNTFKSRPVEVPPVPAEPAKA